MPLGLQMTTVGALGGPGMMGDPGAAAVIEDYWWEIPRALGPGYLTPIWDSTGPMIPGSHDTWSLHPATSAQGYYSPKDDTIVSDEGYWDIGSPADITDTDYIRPIAY